MNPKKWMITGISSGLGKSLAAAVMAQGDFVIGTFRKAEQVEAFNENNLGKGKAFLLDVTNPAQIETVITEAMQEFEQIDVLVNNAGIGFIGAVEETSSEEVRKLFEANFFGALHVTQTVLPFMRKLRSGHIIQVSSHGGLKAFAGFGIYNASKFALEGFSEALAQEIAPLGIRLSIVEPGPFRTGFAGNGLGQAKTILDDYQATAGAFRSKLQGVHGKQEGDPEKAAKAIINLANSENPPLRLPLGKTALLTIGMKLESVKADLEAGRKIAESVVFEDGTLIE